MFVLALWFKTWNVIISGRILNNLINTLIVIGDVGMIHSLNNTASSQMNRHPSQIYARVCYRITLPDEDTTLADLHPVCVTVIPSQMNRHPSQIYARVCYRITLPDE